MPGRSDAATVHVPADAPSIQQAINVAVDGDTVVVSPGVYFELINFSGKAVTVTSEAGPASTTIDGRGLGSVVTFTSGETRSSVLSGFTVRSGFSTLFGGGVFIRNSSPTIRGNRITSNGSCVGAGIYSSFGSPRIEGNVISQNVLYGCTGGFGLGVFIGGNSAAEVIGNQISENSGAANGGGIALNAAGSAIIEGNVISRNVVSGFIPCSQGGGIYIINFAQATIVNNLIVQNGAGCGGGLYWQGSHGSTVVVNNTFADNDAPQGSAILATGVDARNQLSNNILAAKAGQTALFCQSAPTLSPVMNSNDVFGPQGLAYGGSCADQTGLNGNVSADPLFIDSTHADYRVQMTSPAIDAGNSVAPQIPPTDLAGNPRIVDGDGVGGAVIDIGAFEYMNRAPTADAGPDQALTADGNCRAIVSLHGTGVDSNGDPLRFTWTGPFGTVSGATPSVTLPAGSHVITLTVSDGNGGFASDVVVMTVRDVTPPTINAITATPDTLLQANHQLVPVTLSVSVSDACDASVRCQVVSVVSNEPVDGLGDGDTAPDWEVTGDLTLNIRAERAAQGVGRLYTITIACSDSAGNVSTKTVNVNVPRNN